jgi:4-amino-4-deoxy-L-arabinose transferase-like glycosyltransferase
MPDDPSAQPVGVPGDKRFWGRVLGGGGPRVSVRLALLFAVAGVLGLLAVRLCEAGVVSVIAGRLPADKLTPVLWQTLAMKFRIVECAGWGCLAAAIAALLIPVSRWPLGVLLASAFLLSAAARWTTPDLAFDLFPCPDGSFYAALACRLTHGSLEIPVGPHPLPSRFAPGTSLIMTAAQWLRPDELHVGVWAIYACGLLTILLAYYAGRVLFSRPVGVIAALLVAVSPAHGYYGRLAMSEVPLGLFVLAAFVLLFHPKPGAGKRLAGGVLLGLGMLFKPQHVFLMAGAGVAMLVFVWRRRASFRSEALPAAVGAILGLIPWLALNHVLWGQWLTTGYNHYDTNRYSLQAVFGAQYLFGPPIEKGSLGNVPYYAAALLGFDPRTERMPWLFPVAGLAVAAFWAWLRGSTRTAISAAGRRFLAAAGVGSLIFGIVFLFYYYQDVRFFLPVLPLCFVAAAVPLAGFLSAMTAEWRTALAAVCVIGVAAVGLAVLRVEGEGLRPRERDLCARLAVVRPRFEVLVTDLDPVVLGWYGIWTRERPVLPFIRPGEDWFPDDPHAYRRQHGTFMFPSPGTLAMLEPYARRGDAIAFWVRRPALYRDLEAELRRRYVVTPQQQYGLPGFATLTVREAAEPPGKAASAGIRAED